MNLLFTNQEYRILSTAEKGKEADIFNLVIFLKWETKKSTQSKKKNLIYVNENNFSLKFFHFIVSNNEKAAAILK